MTPEIKNRIEQIRRGEVPEGYKKTRAGIIPLEWQEKDLSDVLKKQTKKNADNSVNNVLTNSATRGIIRQTEYFDKQIANDENKEGYYIVKPGYFVYNPRISVGAPCGPFNKYYGETTGIMSPLYTVYKYADDSQYYSEFLSYYFNSSYWHKYMYGIANYGARSDRMNVTSDDMGSLPLPYPSLPEQKKIAEILAAQDRVIELYQRKIDEIKKLKKICLSKMFPQKGHNAPEIRFPEFTDAWEQRKLGDIGSVAMCRRIFKHQTSESGEIPFFKIGTFGGEPDAFITRELFEEFKAKYPYPDKGDILISASGSIGRTVEFTGGNEYFQDSNIVWLKHDKSIINPFLRHLYSVVEWAGIEGSTIKRLYNDNILKTEVMLPSVQEQTKIAEMLDGIDSLITLHQRKLEELQKSKKALMQLLLTGIVRVNV